MPRRRITLPDGNTTIPDVSQADDPFAVRFFKKEGASGIAIYVRSAYFLNLEVWDKHVLGRNISKIIKSRKYAAYYKCIFFDSTEDESTQSQMSEWLDTVWTLTFQHGGQENIYLFTLCAHCENLATIKWTMDHLPKYITKSHACSTCC